MTAKDLDQQSITALRMLAVDAVEAARSGHPGMPLGAAPMAYVLWSRFLKQDPTTPGWPDRDRFVLSAGHGSALLYALLYLFGHDLALEEVRNFRQMGSRTPGHPEHGHTPGVEATTGPLGQGMAMAAGMALAERHLAREFPRPGLVDHTTYAIVSDGDLMEGISSETASFAGHNRLGKLICLYDDNRISIEGSTSLAFTEDVGGRFQAMGWQVGLVEDGEDLAAIEAAIAEAKAETGRPSLIRVRTRIGFGSPHVDTAKVHGEPLGTEGVAKTREFFQWPHEPFFVPDEIRNHCLASVKRGQAARGVWEDGIARWRHEAPAEAHAFLERLAGRLPTGWEAALPVKSPGEKAMATRSASGVVMNALAPVVSGLMGGSADLAPSTKTHLANQGERNLHFGVRELAMGAMANGMALHGGLIPYTATFLVFSDYMRPAIRLSAIMGTHVVHVLTHDSIAVGEDGPTHQPVEHLASLRAIPDLLVLRPADFNETSQAWGVAVAMGRPVAMILSRQDLPILPNVAEGVARGAYIQAEGSSFPRMILMASGSEVSLALDARKVLEERGIATRVVSMPSWELFLEQEEGYRQSVLPSSVRGRLAVEAGCSMGWHRFVGDGGGVVAVDRFGLSGPGNQVMATLGFTVDHVVAEAEKVLGRL